MHTLHIAEPVLESNAPSIYGIVPSDLGWGYDTLQEAVKFDALKNLTTASSAGTSEIDFLVEYDYKKIREKLGIKTSAKSDTGITTVKLSVDVTDVLDSENTSVYFFWSQRIINKRIKITAAVASDRATALLQTPLNNKAVYANLGNRVITEISNGGELILIATFSSRSKEESMKIKAKLDGNTKIFTSDIELHLQLDYLRKEVNQNSSYSIRAKAPGGSMNDAKLTNPATAQPAIEAWVATLVDNPATLEFECQDLTYIDDRFREVSHYVNSNQDVIAELNNMLISLDDSKTLAIQYQKARRDLNLPNLASVRETIANGEVLKSELIGERARLYDTAATEKFRLNEQFRTRFKTIRQQTPVFNYKDLGQGQSCGFIDSGMEHFGDEMEHTKYFANMEVITDVGLQGFRVSFDKFDSAERVNRSYAQMGGNRIMINMEKDLLVSMQGWDMQRSGYQSVRSIQFKSISGATYGPPVPPTETATRIEGSATEGHEKYIISLWGRGGISGPKWLW